MNNQVITGVFVFIMIGLALFAFVDTAITGDIPCFTDENAYCY